MARSRDPCATALRPGRPVPHIAVRIAQLRQQIFDPAIQLELSRISAACDRMAGSLSFNFAAKESTATSLCISLER